MMMVPSFEDVFYPLVILYFTDHVAMESKRVFHYLLIYVKHLLLVDQLQVH